MLDDKRVKIFLLTLAVALTAGIAVKAFVGFKAPPVERVSTTAEQGQEIVVYVTGAVVKSGLVKLPAGARLAEALLAAGQAPEADISKLNLAEKLKDGQKIVVPKTETAATTPVSPQPGPAAKAPAAKTKVNINTAGVQELDTLPGIGPAMAERIIAYRNEKGPFKQAEDLKQVSGIGEKKYAELADFITVD